MKKIVLILLLALSVATSGCKNPISASVEKEGDKTREDMIVELDAAKQDIYNAFKKEIDQSSQSNQDLINAYMQYLIKVLSSPRIS